MKQWYEEFFENASRKYDQESFTRGTLGQCDFIEQEIESDKSIRILDVGCGTGRHAIELTGRGYNITGVDLSPSQITRQSWQSILQHICFRSFHQNPERHSWEQPCRL